MFIEPLIQNRLLDNKSFSDNDRNQPLKARVINTRKTESSFSQLTLEELGKD